MILGFVGGESDLNQELGDFLDEDYGVEPRTGTDGLEEHDGDVVVTDVNDEEDARWLHDDLGARLIFMNHPDNGDEETLRDLCSVSVDCAGGYDRAREKLEMILMGCC